MIYLICIYLAPVMSGLLFHLTYCRVMREWEFPTSVMSIMLLLWPVVVIYIMVNPESVRGVIRVKYGKDV